MKFPIDPSDRGLYGSLQGVPPGAYFSTNAVPKNSAIPAEHRL